MAELSRRDKSIARAAIGVCGALAIILVLTVAVAVARVRWFGETAQGELASAYKVGASIDVPRELYQGSPSTTLIFVSATCGACNRSKSELRRLVQLVQNSRSRAIMVVGSTQPESHTEFATAIGLDPGAVQRLDLASLRLSRVPTVLVTDSDGRITFAHEGVIEASDSTSVVEQVSKIVARQEGNIY